MEVSKELGIAQSVISRLWQPFQDDDNVSRCHNIDRPRKENEDQPNEDRHLAVTSKETDGSQNQTCLVSSLQLPSARYPLPPREHNERHRYSGAGWLVWVEIILGSRTDLHVQSVTMTGHIYWDVILEQHVRLFRGAMGAEYLFLKDNIRPYRTNIVDECLQSENITLMDWRAYSPDLNPIEHV
ncbi:cubilin [Trichonephila clavipes]|nr:cubilin [Trichonephila clavipes]